MSYTRLEFSAAHTSFRLCYVFPMGWPKKSLDPVSKKYHNLCSDNQLKLSKVKKAHCFVYIKITVLINYRHILIST